MGVGGGRLARGLACLYSWRLIEGGLGWSNCGLGLTWQADV